MSALFDLHFVLRARSAWAGVAADVNVFTALFPSIEDQTLLTGAFANLAPDGDADHLEIRPGYSPQDPARLPMIIVTLGEEPADDQPLGLRTGYLGDGVDGEGILLRQNVTAHIMTSQAITTRLLHAAFMGQMLAQRGWFATNGYVGFEYAGGGDFSPSQDFMPEYLGAYGRIQRWTTLAHADFAELAATHKTGVVASTDQTVGDTVGGVAAVQQIG
jgi:hypothetical protein